jgi:hypothetical protein
MNLRKTLIAATLAALGAAAAAPALAWHHGPRIGISFGFGFPYYGGYFPYYAPYGYYPPAVVAPPPVAYVEQSSAPVQQAAPAAPAQGGNYWHFCRESNAYYPYVQTCPSEWQRVAPSPQGR